ncbi:alpha/beta fold hydrolase [Chitinophaga rhizosphaerae]|uniref:alpha/beta fold hydrolase n=1 Tax=Chitinophaga rhizosphaerae TaxID=1864947 RepID=UPI0037449091
MAGPAHGASLMKCAAEIPWKARCKCTTSTNADRDRSTIPENGHFSLARMVEDIENVRQATGSEQVYLIAHSFGGILAFNFALRYQGDLLPNVVGQRSERTGSIGVDNWAGRNYAFGAEGECTADRRRSARAGTVPQIQQS